MSVQEAGRLGGEAVMEKYDHEEIGRKSGKVDAKQRKYKG